MKPIKLFFFFFFLFVLGQVKGMQAAMMFTLTTHNGTLRLKVVECGAHIDDLKIESQGGVLPWLYQL